MGKKKTATSTKSPTTENDPVTPAKPKRANEKASGKKTPLAKKAVKAVAAVALGVGSAIAAKRTKRKTAATVIAPPPMTETLGEKNSPSIPTHEEIALRAYFLSEVRRAAGNPADPHQDWVDAERELRGSPRCQAT